MSEQQLAHAIRILAVDAIESAQSGHPGMPLGMAEIATVLWREFLQHQPSDPNWFNRDRLVVSNGHGAMLLYAALYLRGYAITLDDLKAFRQLGSKTPGHPELDQDMGVETTTGPLGQGFANAVGMAMAEQILAQQYNQPGFKLVDHDTYVLLGDGCLMEGVSHEAASLAGTLGLSRLTAIWDDNGISIDGAIDHWCKDDVPARFEAYGWRVIREVDGHDMAHIRRALREAREAQDHRPTLICCQTRIGFGAPGVENTAKAHGAPLGPQQAQAMRDNLGWSESKPFVVDDNLLAAWRQASPGVEAYENWQQLWLSYKLAHPVLAKQFSRVLSGALPENFTTDLWQKMPAFQSQASRKSSGVVIQKLCELLPELVGGSADLSESNCTILPTVDAYQSAQPGHYIHYGVREFGMFAIMNGLALHGGLRTFGGTFLTFSDYGRNAIRLAAQMQLPIQYVLTHDSVGLGEDGPTHQPIEHIACLRAIPGLDVWRPCDTLETTVAWQEAMQHQRPSALLLSRQTLDERPDDLMRRQAASRGGYILFEHGETPEIILIATGSEVGLAWSAAKALAADNVAVRLVSMPCMELFSRQSSEWQCKVLPPPITTRLAIEAGISQCWHRWVHGKNSDIISIETYGHSAPGDQVFAKFGFTESMLVSRAKSLISALAMS